MNGRVCDAVVARI